MPTNSYTEQMNRVATAIERIAAGAGTPLAGRTLDLATDDGVRAAVAAVVRALGGEVANA